MVWDAFIAIYLFLAGLGAGAFVLGALTNWAKKPAARMKRIAFIIAPVAVAVGTLVLVIDAKAGFANPLRFFMLVSNLNSVMAWGVIILSVFLAVSIVDLVLLLVKKRTPKALDIAGMVLAVCVAAYTGVLLGDAGLAFPLWNMAVLPVLFVVSAASTGIAAVLLATRLAAPEEAGALPLLSKAGLVLPVLELVLVAVLLLAQIALVLEGVVSQTLIPAVDGTLVPAFEVMTANNAVRNLIRESKAHQLDNVIAQSAAQGMITLDQSILKLAQAGRIAPAEALRYCMNPEWLQKRLSAQV